MKNQIGNYLIVFSIGVISMFLLMKSCEQEPDIVEVPVHIEVPVPSIEKEFDTIKLPPQIIKEKEIDSVYYKEYLKLKDSIARDSAYRDAITIREYKPYVEDDTIRIDIYAKVRGSLLESQISYKTKPYTIPVDTIISVPIPKYSEFYGGIETFIPYGDSELKAAIIPSIDYINKKHTLLYNLGVDPFNKGVKGGIKFRF